MLAEEDLRSVLRAALARGGDLAEVFLESRSTTRLTWQEGRLDAASSGSAAGAGVRLLRDGRTAYASTTETTPAALLAAARVASELSDQDAGPVSVPPLHGGPGTLAPPQDDGPGIENKIERIREAGEGASRADPAVAGVVVQYLDIARDFDVSNSLGERRQERQRYARLHVNALARRGNTVRSGRAGCAASGDRDILQGDPPLETAEKAARKAVRMLEARDVPPGVFPVVLAPGEGAILFHEAVGHSLEGDIVSSGNSIFRDRVGETVAAPGVTLVDDATPAGLGGSFETDDEGTPARRTLLIENGILAGFLHDRLSASRTGAGLTGNGRRQDFRFPPIPRMTNTYLAPGDLDPEEILASVDRGLYVRGVGAGQSNTNSGGFTFEVLDADWIENGRLVHPVCHAALVGDAFSVLRNLDGIGNDFAFGPSGGMCGKGQLVPVGEGMPTVRVKEMVVGGRG